MTRFVRFTFLASTCLLLLAACTSPSPTVPPAATATPMPGSVSPTATATPVPATIPPQPTATAVPTTVSSQATPTPGYTPRATTAIGDLGRTGRPIEVDIDSYRLVVDGLVERPLSLSYDDLLSYPTVTQVPRLECPGVFVNYAEWTGPLVRTLLEEAGVKPEATEVEFSDGSERPYRRTLTLEEALRDDTYLAYKVNGETLPVEHGYPVRLVVGSKVGSFWVKWLFRIEVK